MMRLMVVMTTTEMDQYTTLIIRTDVGSRAVSIPKRCAVYSCAQNQNTFSFVINHYVVPDSEIYTDQFSSYKEIDFESYTHRIVNHSKFYVDPVSIRGI